MGIPIGRTHYVEMAARGIRQVTCDACDEQFAYEVQCTVQGSAFNPLFLAGEGTTIAARERAEEKLPGALESTRLAVLCPGCHCFQQDMFADARQNEYRAVKTAGVLLFIFAALIGAAGVISVDHARHQAIPIWSIAGASICFVASMLAFAARYVLLRRFNPNDVSSGERQQMEHGKAITKDSYSTEIARVSQTYLADLALGESFLTGGSIDPLALNLPDPDASAGQSSSQEPIDQRIQRLSWLSILMKDNHLLGELAFGIVPLLVAPAILAHTLFVRTEPVAHPVAGSALLLILFVVGIVFLRIGMVRGTGLLRLLRSGVRVSGNVLGVEMNNTKMEVHFSYQIGDTIYDNVSDCKIPNVHAGMPVTVVHDPEHPEHSVILDGYLPRPA